MSWNMNTHIRRLFGDQRGAIALMTGLGLVAFMGFSAIVVDVGYLVYAKRALQASTDAAALAGAQNINKSSGGTAISAALLYSATPGSMNAITNLDATVASGYPMLKCFSSTGVSCTGPDSANGIVVKQEATVPLFFGKVLGLDTAQISASAAAGSRGGTAQPVDAIIILDASPSMNTTDPNCATSSSTRIQCAFTGFRTLLAGFRPSLDHVGVMIFPGLKNSTNPARTAAQNAALEYDCSSSTPADPWFFSPHSNSAIASYNESSNQPTASPPLYLIVPLSNDYKTSDNADAPLNSSSNLVKAARGGASGCTAGVSATSWLGYGIVVRTFFADAVEAAKDYLMANGRTDVQKLIIFLGDGDAGAPPSQMPAGRSANQCRQAITQAQAATAAGMTVITIAYGASTSTSGSEENCPYDTPRLSPCETLRQMASTADRFYSTNTGSGSACSSAANPISDLNEIFQHIGTNVETGARLLPDSTS